MNLSRRALLTQATASAWPARAQAPSRALVFPRDHGAHTDTAIEWWYATGWLRRDDGQNISSNSSDAPAWGFQITFFRSRTGLAERIDSRFAARQLLFAHAAVSDVSAQRLHHGERIVRWSGDARAPLAVASSEDTGVHIGSWQLAREASAGRYNARMADDASGLAFDLALQTTQPLLLQGEQGLSRKGPAARNTSRYYSQVQLDARGTLQTADRQRVAVRGRAWLDHEWSDALLPEGAVGWDWIGINLDDGGALTAFRLRDANGAALWAGGSHRDRDGALRIFEANEVFFEPLRRWTSPATRAVYPVQWRLRCPAGEFEVQALFNAQELDGRASTGAVYWEGLSSLAKAPAGAQAGARVGWGYLEMTGYAEPLRL